MTLTNSITPAEWTPAEIYVDAWFEQQFNPLATDIRTSVPMPPFVSLIEDLDPGTYTPAFIDAYLCERNWSQIDPQVELSPEEFKLVQWGGRSRCPICRKKANWLRFHGLDTGLIVRKKTWCPCNRINTSSEAERNRSYAAGLASTAAKRIEDARVSPVLDLYRVDPASVDALLGE